MWKSHLLALKINSLDRSDILKLGNQIGLLESSLYHPHWDTRQNQVDLLDEALTMHDGSNTMATIS
jgi:hypothetical protein